MYYYHRYTILKDVTLLARVLCFISCLTLAISVVNFNCDLFISCPLCFLGVCSLKAIDAFCVNSYKIALLMHELANTL